MVTYFDMYLRVCVYSHTHTYVCICSENFRLFDLTLIQFDIYRYLFERYHVVEPTRCPRSLIGSHLSIGFDFIYISFDLSSRRKFLEKDEYKSDEITYHNNRLCRM